MHCGVRKPALNDSPLSQGGSFELDTGFLDQFRVARNF
jgi:hypothetical protein